MNHEGGHDHSQDHRQRRCDACARKFAWAELVEVFSALDHLDGFWICLACLAVFPALERVPLIPHHDAKSTNLWAVLERHGKLGPKP